jgi:histidinol-phosphate aminotransferase
MGADVSTLGTHEDTCFLLDLDEVNQHLDVLHPRLVFLCNPNNPTGTALPAKVILGWAREYPRTLFVVDEAYLPFAGGVASVLPEAGANILVLRSLTKDLGLAGLRLGYAVGAEALIVSLRRVQPPWSVNALAQAAGVVALADLAHTSHCLEQIKAAKQELVRGLAIRGLAAHPSVTHFFLVRVGHGGKFRQQLLKRGILVRDCASFGLPAWVRIAARRPEDNARLLGAIGDFQWKTAETTGVSL